MCVAKDFEVDRTYEKQILITNVSYTISALKLVDLTSKLKDFIKLQYDAPTRLACLQLHPYHQCHQLITRSASAFPAPRVLSDPTSSNYQSFIFIHPSFPPPFVLYGTMFTYTYIRFVCLRVACSFDPPGQLAAGKSCKLTVTFTPRVRVLPSSYTLLEIL